MVSKTSKSTLWTLSILLTTANLIFAAPSINNEESSGSRAFIHSAPGGLPSSEFDLMPMVEQENAVQALPYQYVPVPATPVRQPSFENAILNYLSAKHLMMSLLNSKARRFNDWDSNEVNRKRSYKLCAFNAVSCFG